MGWLFSTAWPNKSAMIAHLTTPGGAYGEHLTTIAKCVRGSTLWTVHEYTRDRAGFKAGHRWIGCYLIGSDRGSWGYKDMDESMHPYEYSCPLAFLDMAPEACPEWRALVRLRAEKRSKVREAKVGDMLVLREGCTPPRLVVTHAKPLRAVAADDDGQPIGYVTFRVAARLVATVIPAVAR